MAENRVGRTREDTPFRAHQPGPLSGERILIERHGKPVAALLSSEDLARLKSSPEESVEEQHRRALAEAGIRVSRSEPG